MQNSIKIIQNFLKYYNISLNLDLLETGLINIFLLFVILIYSNYTFVKPFLNTRKNTIDQGVKDIEAQLAQASQKLKYIRKQLSEINFAIINIKKKAILKKKNLLQFEAFQLEKKLMIFFEEALLSLDALEKKATLDLKQQMIDQLLEYAIFSTKMAFKDTNFSKESANNIINEL